MQAAVVPHQSLAERLVKALGDGEIEYARLEFPAALVPLREDLEAEDDDMISMDFVVDGEGGEGGNGGEGGEEDGEGGEVDTDTRVLGIVSYADYSSDEYTDAPRRTEWTLFDERGVASFNVLFHDTEDAAAWIKEHGVLTVVPRDVDDDTLDADYGHLVSDLIIGE